MTLDEVHISETFRTWMTLQPSGGRAPNLLNRYQGALAPERLSVVAIERNFRAQESLEFRPAWFDGRRIRRIGWQAEEEGATACDRWLHTGHFVCSAVVHHHKIAGPEGGSQHMLDIGQKHGSIGRAFSVITTSMPPMLRAPNMVTCGPWF